MSDHGRSSERLKLAKEKYLEKGIDVKTYAFDVSDELQVKKK